MPDQTTWLGRRDRVLLLFAIQTGLGTDYPFRSAGETGQGLVASAVFNAAELRAVNRENATRLVPRFRA